MCGIAGFISSEKDRLSTEKSGSLLESMCLLIRHRGPDEQGTWTSGQVALGMRRLSIIDLSGGHQPIFNEDESLVIVFNGEIYNYRELQRELQQKGHTFRSNSDTETIIHAFEEYGPDCLEKLRGMFAFVIWDKRTRTLFAARDRVGKKPFYYTVTGDQSFVFGSELKSILEYPTVKKEVDIQALDAYLSFGYVPDPYSIFKGIRKLPAGSYLLFRDGKVTEKQYWDIKIEPDYSRTEEQFVEELTARLDEAVKIRLISEVPLGAFLSGGIDSSAVVGLMSRNSEKPVKTFSIGFNEDSYNELKYARLTAKHFNTDHHEFVVTPDICEIVDELVWHFDEPFADSSSIPTYMVSKLAREHVTVVLSGDGGDELFGGYTRYLIDLQRNVFGRLPRNVRDNIMNPISRNLPHWAWGRNFLHNVSLDPTDRFIDSVSVFTSLNKGSLYTSDFTKILGQSEGVRLFRELGTRVKSKNSLDPLLYLDSKTYLPGDILTKVDRMSMAVSLEARAPLLDHKLIEMVSRIPASLKIKNNETKYIFKQAIKSFVPHEILNRPKQGFGLPIQQWINNQLHDRIHQTLTDRRTLERGLFEKKYIDVLLQEHERGRRDHSTSLWALFMLELWNRTYMDKPSAAGNLEVVRN
jgi:asparagine synthase (glutamine-hydrolysing)